MLNHLGRKNINTNYDIGKYCRRTIRLKGYVYSQEGAYFVTICTKNRELLLSEITHGKVMLSPTGEIVAQWWKNTCHRFPDIELDEFIIMPNHLHGILIIVGAIHELPLHNSPNDFIQRRRRLLPKIIGYFKMNTSKYINKTRNTQKSFRWQRNYYDRIIRNDKELNRIREYIQSNTIKWEFDKENPRRIPNEKYQIEWKWLEGG